MAKKTTIQQQLKKLEEALPSIEKKQNKDINFFEAVGMSNQEIRHSAFFAWLIQSTASHDLKNNVLRAFFERLYNYENNKRILDKIEIDGNEIGNMPDPSQAFVDLVKGDTVVEKEIHHIDILVRVPETKTLVVIENKVDTTTHDNQLERYSDIVDKEFHDYKRVFVYMTLQGEDPINRGAGANRQINLRYCKFTYGEFLKVLEKVMPTGNSNKERKVKFILEDYIKMCKTTLFHDNPGVYDQCEQVVKDHADAVEAIKTYLQSATNDKVLEKCKSALGAVLEPKGSNMFFTPEMRAIFERMGEPYDKKMFHIVLIKDAKNGWVLRIELELPSAKSSKKLQEMYKDAYQPSTFSPTQQKIIEALATEGLVRENHTDRSVGIVYQDGSTTFTLLSNQEKMDPFDSQHTQDLLNARLGKFAQTLQRVHDVLKRL